MSGRDEQGGLVSREGMSIAWLGRLNNSTRSHITRHALIGCGADCVHKHTWCECECHDEWEDSSVEIGQYFEDCAASILF